MKKNNVFLVALLLTISTTLSFSQDENNPWQFTFGVHAVDLDADTNTSFVDFFAVNENWNASPGLSTFTLSKYIGDNISVGITGSVNEISKFADDYEFINDVTYFALDAMLKYDLSDLLSCQNMEPYLGLGLGNTNMNDTSWITSNASLGITYWFSDFMGLTAQTDYKMNMDDNGRGNTAMLDEGGTMRYSLGLSIKFGEKE